MDTDIKAQGIASAIRELIRAEIDLQATRRQGCADFAARCEVTLIKQIADALDGAVDAAIDRALSRVAAHALETP